FGGALHLGREALLHIMAAPGEKALRLVEQRRVGLALDAADAGGAATLDLEQQAGPGAVGEYVVAARAQQKRLLQRDQRAVDRAGRGERAEISAALVARPAVFRQLREFVIRRQMDERKGFVVAQQHVVA